MSGHTDLHEQLQNELAAFVNKEAAYLLNFGYQGMVSTVDALGYLKMILLFMMLMLMLVLLMVCVYIWVNVLLINIMMLKV